MSGLPAGATFEPGPLQEETGPAGAPWGPLSCAAILGILIRFHMDHCMIVKLAHTLSQHALNPHTEQHHRKKKYFHTNTFHLLFKKFFFFFCAQNIPLIISALLTSFSSKR